MSMKVIPAGTAVTVRIPLVDLEGDPLDVISGTGEVLDADSNVLLSIDSVVDVGDTEATVEIPAEHTQLEAGEDLRIVEVKIVHKDGTRHFMQPVIIQAEVRLTVAVNSFQTTIQSLLTARQLPKSVEWEQATSDEIARVLQVAYQKIARQTLRVTADEELAFDRVPFQGDRWIDLVFNSRTWPHVTAEIFQSLPKRFTDALKLAQVAEAMNLLAPDEIEKKRQIGVMSESIGESSMMFRMSKRIEYGLSQDAIDILAPFITMRVALGRS